MDPGFCGGCIGGRVAVNQFAIGRQGLEAMGTSLGNQKRSPVIGRQLLGMPAKKRGGISPKVDGHIPDLAPKTTDQFHLGVGGMLEVQTADGSRQFRKSMVDLVHRFGPTGCQKGFRAEQPGEKSSCVTAKRSLDYVHT
jgi:hypothetical protein